MDSKLFWTWAVSTLLWMSQVPMAKAGNAVLINNGFENVTIAISSSLSSSQQSSIISGIKTLFDEANNVLYTATGKRAYFATVIIYSPQKWGVTNAAESDTYYSADIRIAPDNPAYGDLPYTQQSRGCGEPGDFIHLTYDFITDPYYVEDEFGPAEKLLVHEWIKYRYGVFDENGYGYDPIYPQQYFGSKNILEYNMCNNSEVQWGTNSCYYDSDVEGIPSHCILDPSTYYYVDTSLLSRVSLPVASEFCDEDNHNSEAPNKQNILCEGRSAMEVILQHEDFQDGKNRPADIYLSNPVFYQETQSEVKSLAFFLVWDPLDSDKTYYTAGPALLKFIYLDFPNNSYFGAIDTINTNQPFINLTQVSDSNRYLLWTELSNGMTSSETPTGNVSNAVNTIVNVLKTAGVTGSASLGAVIFSNNRATSWHSVCTSASSISLSVFLVTYDQRVADSFNADCWTEAFVIGSRTPPIDVQPLQDGHKDTHTSSLSDMEDTAGDLIKCAMYLDERADLDLTLLALPSLISSTFTLPSVYFLQGYTNSTNGSFEIDTSKSSVNYFYVDTCRNIDMHPPSALLSCWLNAPNNYIQYDNTVQEFLSGPLNSTTDNRFGVIQTESHDISAPFVVYSIKESTSTSNNTSIIVRGWTVIGYSLINETDILTNETEPLVVRLFASINHGTSPVFDAKVEAVIKNDNNPDVKHVILLDNGSGSPDIMANDGVYSGYFTQFVATDDFTPITYSVVISAIDNDVATYPTSEYPWISNSKQMDTQFTEPFNQWLLLQFESTNHSMDGDVIPPAKVYDLRVAASQGATVTLAWTAPGDDLDFGTAKNTVFKCSTERQDLIDQFEDLPASEIPDVAPETPGYIQTASFSGISDKLTHFCAMKTFDHAGNKSPISNIISYLIHSR